MFLDQRGRVPAQSTTDSAGGVFYLWGELSFREIEKRATFGSSQSSDAGTHQVADVIE